MAEQKTVVVVEDTPELRELLTDLLEEEGYRVLPLRDGLHAAETVREARPNAVLLDLALPGKDGRAVLEELCSDPETACVPVIVVSAYLHALGGSPGPPVARTISKPFDLDQIVGEVNALAGSGDGRAA